MCRPCLLKHKIGFIMMTEVRRFFWPCGFRSLGKVMESLLAFRKGRGKLVRAREERTSPRHSNASLTGISLNGHCVLLQLGLVTKSDRVQSQSWEGVWWWEERLSLLFVWTKCNEGQISSIYFFKQNISHRCKHFYIHRMAIGVQSTSLSFNLHCRYWIFSYSDVLLKIWIIWQSE